MTMLSHRIAAAGAAILIGASALALAQTQAFKPTIEQDTARPGEDYRYFTPDPASPATCQLACSLEAQCRAWEYDPVTRPDLVRCFLKAKVPNPTRTPGHTAGVLRPDGPFQPAPAQVVEMAIRTAAPNIMRCVDVPDGKFTPGARLRLWDCNTAPAQLFAYELASQHLTIGKLCVQPAGNGQPGAPVELAACGGGDTQAWTVKLKQSHALFVDAAGLCLDIAGGRTDNGTALQVGACTDAVTQTWDFTRVKAP